MMTAYFTWFLPNIELWWMPLGFLLFCVVSVISARRERH